MVDRNATVNLRGDVSNYIRSLGQARTATAAFVRSLDSSNDRMSMLVQTGLALGPALAPITTAAVPALSGLTNQLAFAGIGAGAAVIAFQGVGDALTAVNDFALEPTEANLQKMQETLETLGPAGQDFVAYLQSIRPEMQQLQNVAQEGLFPGVQAGMRDLMSLMPEVEGILSEVSSAMGSLAAEAGQNLASPRWREFFSFLESEARPTLQDLGRTIGNFTEGFAQMWMAFDPISDQFSTSFLNLSRDFREWASSLDESQGFQDFVDYLQRITPKVWDMLGSVAEAMLAIGEAAAPVGEAALPVIEALAEALTLLAGSPAGPTLIAAAAGLSAVSRAVALYNVAQGSAIASLLGGTRMGRAARDLPAASRAYLDFGAALDTTGRKADGFRNSTQRMNTALGGAGRIAAGAAGASIALSDLGDGLALANTASYALIGTLAGPWGAAIGAGIGAAQDFAAINDDVEAAVARADAALANGAGSYEEQRAAVEAANDAFRKFKEDAEDVTLFDPAAFREGFMQIFGASEVEAGTEAMDERNQALERSRIAAQEQTFAEAGLSSEMAGTSQAARDQTESILDSIAALNARRDAILASQNAEIAFEQAIDDAADAAKENGKATDINTQAGRDNRTALLNLAASWNALEPAQQNAAGASDRARKSFIDTAIEMGHKRAEARRLADQLLDIPDDVSTQVRTPGAAAAQDAVRSLNRFLDALPGSKRTHVSAPGAAAARNAVASLNQVLDALPLTRTIRVNTIRNDSAGGSHRGQTRMADGGLVVGPGGPREDRVPAMLSNGEFVMNAFATARHLPALMQMNAKKYADGGLVTASSLQPAVPGIPVASSAQVITTELAGMRIAVDDRGLWRVVDGVVEVAIESYDADRRQFDRMGAPRG